jgi:phosphoglycerate dehydrogenase-like enzyme
MKVVLQYRASPGFRAKLADAAPEWLDIVVVEETDKSTFAEQMRDAEVLLHVLEPVSAEVIADAPCLGLIQKVGIGVNTIDIEAARQRGIAVANMPGANSQSVAELTVALMLATLRRIPYLDQETRQGRGWLLDADIVDEMGEVHGRTVGFLGFGAVPRRVAPVCQALGARIIYHDCTPKPDAPGELWDLEGLLAESDVLSLHLPLTPETANIIDRQALDRMKSGAVLINTARGELVDEPALAEALRSGHLRAAGLDVFGTEPVPADNSLFALENIVVTPHVAWLTPEMLQRGAAIAIENCRRLRDGQKLLHRVV